MEIEEHSGHRDRLRERLRREGIEALKPNEIIELLLCYIFPRQDVNALAREMIKQFGSVRDVLRAEIPELMRVPGSGKRVAEWLALIGECVYACDTAQPEPIEEMTDFLDAMRHLYAVRDQYPPPCTMMMCLDMNGSLIFEREICPSRMWGESEVLCDVVNDALSMKASCMILAEFVGNLPSEPEPYDVEHVRDLSYALKYAGCGLLDFIICAENGVTSFFRSDLLPDLNALPAERCLREAYAESMPDDLTTLKIQDFTQITHKGDDP